jgi:hypothetical protein
MKERTSELDITSYASARRCEVYVDYKGERILTIHDVDIEVCIDYDEDELFTWVMENYSQEISDCIDAIDMY